MKHLVVLLFLSLPLLAAPSISEGTLDLRNYRLTPKSIIRLDGDWSFFWNTFSSYPTIQELPREHTFTIPGFWNSHTHEEVQLGPYGFATYYLTILLPEDRPPILGINSNAANTALRLEINGTEIHASGIPGESRHESTPKYLPRYSFFRADHDTLHVTLHISNFEDAKGGPWFPLVFGGADALRGIRLGNMQRELFYFGSTLIMGTIFLFMYLFGTLKHEKYELFFSLSCYTAALRISLTGERFLIRIFLDIPWEFFLRLEYATLSLLILFYSYCIFFFFRKIYSPRILKLITYTSVGYILFFCVTPPQIFTRTITPYLIFIALMLGYLLLVNLRGACQKIHTAQALLAGNIIVFISAIHDILANTLIFIRPPLLPAGVFILLLTQAGIIAYSFARTKHHTIHLIKKLRRTNEALTAFLPREFLALLNKQDLTTVNLGDQVSGDMTILFAEFQQRDGVKRHITMEELNDHLSYISPVISYNNGFIDKYLHNGLMCIFPSSCQDGITAATEIVSATEQNNSPLDISLGLHRGTVILGTVGSQRRIDTTVISDTVNISSRIQALSKIYGSKITVTQEIIDTPQVKDAFTYRILDSVRVKGKNFPITVYEVLDGLREREFTMKCATIDLFYTALESFLQEKYTHALTKFLHIREQTPEDPVINMYIERCNSALKGPSRQATTKNI
ncbi:adenylate/guanylate cyclase domain-containing protein [Chitinivibrio alkaliphilus]|uniref:Adenylate cyclase family protein n=1 Tax=Chitinivibrio alkaliphilus ACht1 TaxID=1313304 RepID=U7D9G3_9BACT|nr:adenylate/guanylate cyclase domain-containing protein [Chitinivibrio alkaliphilus]ERP31050.1 adenylate cyclase family protein [Chitinivibrio alkaliphilus ACht1]